MCIFALSRTTIREQIMKEKRCELLQNVYLCIITYNIVEKDFIEQELWIASKCVSLHYHVQQELVPYLGFNVVNCFKMCIFALSRTTSFLWAMMKKSLWIASKCVSLHYHVQRIANPVGGVPVVNCFKMCIFALSRTTACSLDTWSGELWIASKCVSLHYHVQLDLDKATANTCCELLQNVYLCIITYND